MAIVVVVSYLLYSRARNALAKHFLLRLRDQATLGEGEESTGPNDFFSNLPNEWRSSARSIKL